jgi:predicted RNase H-like nuclease (RuvC/YqgF family)
MTDEELKRLLEANAERVEKRFDTPAMIKFSYAELDRRVRSMEQTLVTLENRVTGLERRVDRLKEATKTEN